MSEGKQNEDIAGRSAKEVFQAVIIAGSSLVMIAETE